VVIAFNSIVLLILGYWLVQAGRYQFPFILIFIILSAMTVAANVIDLKDIKGDQAGKINTLPILLGEKQAKHMIGLAYIILFSGFICVVSNWYWLVVFTGAGLIQFYLVNKKNYREWQVIAFSNACLFSLIIILLLEKS
jgi:1,4-dihydroxy-2-naphthoate octaprenyltransferase